MVQKTLAKVDNSISDNELNWIITRTDGYSAADLASLCKEAAMEPVREIPPDKILSLKDSSALRKVNVKDFEKALSVVTPSVSKKTILEYAMWHKAT